MLESNKSHNNKTNTLFQLQITTWRSKVMSPVSSMPWSFFLLLLFFNGILARVIPNGAEKNIETVYDSQKRDDDHLCLNHAHDDDDDDDDGHGCHKHIHSHMHAYVSSSNSHDHQMDPSLNVFFHFDDLKMGKNIPLYFPIKDPSKIPQMIPKKEANSIPFSKTHLNQILDFFKFSQDSSQAKAIEETLNHCELPPIKGETKFCATSLESMLDKLTQIFGFGNKFKVLTTTQMRNWTPQLQNYTILKDAHEIYVNKMVGCHPMPYPYAVFYCHMQKGDTKLFELSLEGEKDGVRVDALGICHMDTSEWDPQHASFRVLGVKPGSEPVCHVFPQDNLVWVSSPSYVN